MTLTERVEAFAELGLIMTDISSGKETKFSSRFNVLIDNLHLKNPWFTPDNIRMSLQAIGEMISHENLTKWVNNYPSLNDHVTRKDVAAIMAGNIPLVGFHDLLAILICGHNIMVKASSKDDKLITLVCEVLTSINPSFQERINVVSGALTKFDAVIATGSNNSSRYFDYYFGKYPHIIRKSRNSIAILDGSERDEELADLGVDIFSFFGLGCRSVSKVFIPETYQLPELIRLWDDKYHTLANHSVYANNYDYYKAIYLVNKTPFLDSGYLLLKEDEGIASPVAVLFYERYDSIDSVERYVRDNEGEIQCIVGHHHTPFGKSQHPELWEYADGVDTIDFLLKIND